MSDNQPRPIIGQVRGLQRALIWVLTPMIPYDGFREMFPRMCPTNGIHSTNLGMIFGAIPGSQDLKTGRRDPERGPK